MRFFINTNKVFYIFVILLFIFEMVALRVHAMNALGIKILPILVAITFILFILMYKNFFRVSFDIRTVAYLYIIYFFIMTIGAKNDYGVIIIIIGSIIFSVILTAINFGNRSKLLLNIFSATAFGLMVLSVLNFLDVISIETKLFNNISIFTDQNEFAIFCIIGLAIYVFRKGFLHPKAILYALLTMFCVMSTGSRRAIIFFIFLFLILIFKTNRINENKNKLLVMFGSLFIAGTLIYFFNTQLIHKIDITNISRISEFITSFGGTTFQERNNISTYYIRQYFDGDIIQILFGNGAFSSRGSFSSSPHNYFVSSLYECGMIGFLLIFWFTIKCIKTYVLPLFNKLSDKNDIILGFVWLLLIYNFFISGAHILESQLTWYFITVSLIWSYEKLGIL